LGGGEGEEEKKVKPGTALLWEKEMSAAHGFLRWRSSGDLLFHTKIT